jgi:hypothetical protein
MKGATGLSVGFRSTLRMIRTMLGRIPSTLRKIDPTTKSEPIIYDDEFLMMGRSHWMDIVLLKMETSMRQKLGREPPFSLREVQHVKIPHK